jgi:hypothetical protein
MLVVAKKDDKKEYVNLLQAAIQQKHQCVAVHRESVYVHEKLDGQTIWEGQVEVFDLTDHADAGKCYAWSFHEKGMRGNILNTESVRLITVLGKRPVDSPAMAVRAAIFYDVQPAPAQPLFRNTPPKSPSSSAEN